MHTDFNVPREKDHDLLFGILALKKTTTVCVKPMDGEEGDDVKLGIKPGHVFLA